MYTCMLCVYYGTCIGGYSQEGQPVSKRGWHMPLQPPKRNPGGGVALLNGPNLVDMYADLIKNFPLYCRYYRSYVPSSYPRTVNA